MINLIVILQNFTWMNEMGTMSWKCQDLQNVLEYGPPAHTHPVTYIYIFFFYLSLCLPEFEKLMKKLG